MILPPPNQVGDGSIFDRLYQHAKNKRETDDRRCIELDAARKYPFKPTITSTYPTRGKVVYQELFRDAAQKKSRAEALARDVAEEREAQRVASPIPHRRQPAHARPHSLDLEEETAQCTFAPRTNQRSGVVPRYLDYRHQRFQPAPLPVQAQTQDGRPEWISPLEASRREAAEQDRLKVRSGRSVALRRRQSDAYGFRVPEDEGLVPFHPAAINARRPRAKSAEASVRSPPPSSAQHSPSSSPRRRFHYVPKASNSPVRISRALEFGKGDAFESDFLYARHSRSVPQRHYPSTGLQQWSLYSRSYAHAQGPTYPTSTAPARSSSVGRSVDSKTRVVDLT